MGVGIFIANSHIARRSKKEMKTDRMLFVMVAAYSMAISLWAAAHAEEAWYTCKVVQTSPAWGESYVRLTHEHEKPCFANKWFKLRESRDRRMCGVVKSAQQNGGQVAVLADISRGIYPTIGDMRLP